MLIETTIDGILNHRIAIEQPKKGYRVAIDTLLLAAAVPAKANDRILELGCGVGGAMLALACRVPGVMITGVDIQPELTQLCQSNIERNALNSELNVLCGDVTALPEKLIAEFNHVMMNPPYNAEARHDASKMKIKRLANIETSGDLEKWIRSAAKALNTDGTLTLIHRADRQEEIISYLINEFGGLVIKPIVTRPDTPPKRIIVRAIKGALYSLKVACPLIIHAPDGRYTSEADAVLRDSAPILVTFE